MNTLSVANITKTENHAPCLPVIPLAKYCFSYTLVDDLPSGVIHPTIWHSVLGHALKNNECTFPGLDCKQCSKLHSCHYPSLFRPPPPEKTELMGKSEWIMPPHVFQFDSQSTLRGKAGDNITIDIVVAGHANQMLMTLVKAMITAGKFGLGKKRTRLELDSVTQILPPQNSNDEFSTTRHVVYRCGSMRRAHSVYSPELPATPSYVAVEWLTPYIIRKRDKTETQSGVDIRHWLFQIVQRVSFLQYFYTGEKLNADFYSLKLASRQISWVVKNNQFVPAKRYSAAHQKELDVSGWVGQYTLDISKAPELWPYLYLGQWFNVPTNASMGFGQYHVTPC